MTQETKDKLKQAAAEKYPISGGLVTNIIKRSAFKAGAKTILDNYYDYGLQSMEKYKDMVSANVRLGAENQRLREALVDITSYLEGTDYHDTIGEILIHIHKIAKEALKQQDDEINKK